MQQDGKVCDLLSRYLANVKSVKSCPSCGNLQCYVCSESLKDYNHFDQTPRGLLGAKSSKCPLYDNVEERHEREIKEAEAAARAEVISENPDVSEQDLEIKLSDAVKKATDERVKRAGAVPGGIPPGYGGFAAAGFPAGLYMPPGMGQRFRDRANNLEADLLDDEDEEDGPGEHLRRRRQLLDLERLRERFAAVQNVIDPRDVPHNRPALNAAPAPNADLALNPANVAPAAAAGRRPLPPRRQQLPPRAAQLFQPIPGGFNEDPFGGGDDGDPLALHRLLYAPPRPPLNPAPALPADAQRAMGAHPNPAVEANQERIREIQLRMENLRNQRLRVDVPQAIQQPRPAQDLQQQRLNEAEQLRRLEARTLLARQRFDDNRGGQGVVFRRERQDPRRYHRQGGWPGQN